MQCTRPIPEKRRKTLKKEAMKLEKEVEALARKMKAEALGLSIAAF